MNRPNALTLIDHYNKPQPLKNVGTIAATLKTAIIVVVVIVIATKTVVSREVRMYELV